MSDGRKKLAITAGAAATLMVSMVALWEGKRNVPYVDIVGTKTVCFGETRVKMRVYTDAECQDMLAGGLNDFAMAVAERNPNLRNRPNQFAAATSLAYNIGIRAYNGSTVARRFSAGDYRGACNAILAWNRAGGRVVQGLSNRRQYERARCLIGL
jgi:lysozyme